MSNTNTIIQEKVKEFEKKFCYWHYKDNTGAVCKPSTDGFKFVTAKAATDWLTKALTSLVKEVREEETRTTQEVIGEIFDNNYDEDLKTYDTDGIAQDMLDYWQKIQADLKSK